jgi:hypothetical protein
MDVIAERTYERAGAPGLVRLALGRPEPDPEPGGDWRCRMVIEGLGDVIDRHAYGVDALQALGLAFEMARAHLQPSPSHGPGVTWLGQADLGLPRSVPIAGGR